MIGNGRNVRSRSAYSSTPASSDAARKKRIAQAISARLRARFPYKDYGAAYYQRGSPASLATFGPSGRGANAAQKANRRNSGFVGRGAYWGKEVGQYLGGMAGASLAGMVGQPELAAPAGMIGSSLGGQAGDYMSDKIMNHLSGRGAYSTNSLVNPKITGARNTSSRSDETGDVVITHSEYLKDIVPTSSDFETQYFQAINPGVSDFLPWLSQMAAFYEEYEIIQLVYTFKSMVHEGNNSAAGTVMMATQYNPTSAPFILKQNMENYDYASSCKVSDNLIHGVECDPSKKAGNATEYIRVQAVPSGQDPKTYDLGVVQLATTGVPGGLNIGELWVHYKIRLSKAKIALPGSFAPSVMLSSTLNLQWTTGTIGTGANIGALFGSALTTDAKFSEIANVFQPLGHQVEYHDRANFKFNGSNNTIFFPPWVNGGQFIVRFTFQTTAATFGAPVWTTVAGGIASGATIVPAPSTTANGYTVTTIFNPRSPTGTSSTIRLGFASGSTVTLSNGSTVTVSIIQVENDFEDVSGF